MSVPAPAGAVCGAHPGAPATWTCGRCGAFFCAACERRTRPDALPMCPTCWALREQAVRPRRAESETRLQSTGLGMGVLALVPSLWWLQLAGIVVNVVGLLGAREGAARAARWRSVLGLALSLLGLAGTVAVFLWAQRS